MNAVLIGLSEPQLGDVLVKLTNAESTVLRVEEEVPCVVVHPFMLIAAILDCFSEEDGMFINKSIDHLKSLQQKISANEALTMGNLSIELNQLSSDLRAIQMGNVYMQSLAKEILASHYTIKDDSKKAKLPMSRLVDYLKYSGSPKNEHLKSRPAWNQWAPLLEQFDQIGNDLEALGIRCEDRKFDIECLQKQIDINLNVVSTHINYHC